ncbi:MAG: hypothetical protein HQK89_13135 [Nitrospirae bacterium]|nr:hypothetical protein [Nitrospirota bacterium]
MSKKAHHKDVECHYCKKLNPYDAIKCDNCGAILWKASEEEKGTLKVTLIVIAVVAAMGAIIYWSQNWHGTANKEKKGVSTETRPDNPDNRKEQQYQGELKGNLEDTAKEYVPDSEKACALVELMIEAILTDNPPDRGSFACSATDRGGIFYVDSKVDSKNPKGEPVTYLYHWDGYYEKRIQRWVTLNFKFGDDVYVENGKVLKTK